MNEKSKSRLLLELFITFFKIGLFTFGGGYAMIALLENEFIERKKWIENDEFMDMTAIAESTPGPIAINSATYIGYKTAGVLGSAVSTLGVVLPSFIIIFVISLFFEAFLEIKFVAAAFKGIQACVIYLIFSAGVKMFKKLKKSVFNMIIFAAVVICTVTFSLFSIKFSSVFYVLISGVIGLIFYTVAYCVERKKSDKKEDKE